MAGAMSGPFTGIALHTWTLDTTPFDTVVSIAREVGFDALELRRADFDRCIAAGHSASYVIDTVLASGLAVSAVGVQPHWLHAEGEELDRLMAIFDEQCERAQALGCPLAMSAIGEEPRDGGDRVSKIRRAGDIAAKRGLRVTFEFGSQNRVINTLPIARALVDAAAHPAVGLLVDLYHMQRSGDGDPGCYTALNGVDVNYVQYSDVPPDSVPGAFTDRLPPGQGIIPFGPVFAALADSGYRGYISYEAPNPVAWERDPRTVAAEALAATKSYL
jgi:sugar phosphate isomerase/epimerase